MEGFNSELCLCKTAADGGVADFTPPFSLTFSAKLEELFAGEEVLEDGVLKAEEEDGSAGIALASAAADELVIDAAGFMALGADDMQTTEGNDAGAEFDIRAAAGHVGGDGDGA